MFQKHTAGESYLVSNLIFCLPANPDKDKIKEELSLLSASYGFVFRVNHVDNLLAKLEQVER